MLEHIAIVAMTLTVEGYDACLVMFSISITITIYLVAMMAFGMICIMMISTLGMRGTMHHHGITVRSSCELRTNVILQCIAMNVQLLVWRISSDLISSDPF